METDPAPSLSRRAYVEDAPEPGASTTVALVNAPPAAPSPPAALPPQNQDPVNVFDFLVNEETPNASRISLAGPKEPMRMKAHAPPIFEAVRQASLEAGADNDTASQIHDPGYEANGYTYGTAPISAKPRLERAESFVTPAPNRGQKLLQHDASTPGTMEKKSTDKKRKRQQIEELHLTHARPPSHEVDEVMIDAPPLLHTGLTGGLNRLLTKSRFPPSPEYSGNDNEDHSEDEDAPLSPVKTRSTGAHDSSTGSQTTHTHRRRKATTAASRSSKVSHTSSRRTSDESRPRKHHRSHHHHQPDDDHHSTTSKRSSHKPRLIEAAPTEGPHSLVVYDRGPRAELFLSFVTKGPESESGCSLNKALKRYHRERGDKLGAAKQEEEKELWKSLRLRRNERGEVVLLGVS